jgi:homoserine acetyltransferase
MLGHVTYLSDRGMHRKFGRRLRPDSPQHGFGREFEVESYLEHQGQAFVDRFDANSLLYLTRAIDDFDLAPDGGTLRDAFSASGAAFLFLTFSSGWLYPPYTRRGGRRGTGGGPARQLPGIPASGTARSCSSTRRRPVIRRSSAKATV